MNTLKNRLRGPWPPEALIVAVALFVVTFANTSFFSTALETYPLDGGNVARNLPFLSSLFFYVTGLFVILLSLLCHRVLLKPVLIAFLVLASVIAYFTNEYGAIFDHRMIENILETDIGEARDLLSLPLALYVLLLGVVPSVVVWLALVERRPWKRALLSRATLTGTSLALVLGIYFAFSAQYASMFRMQRHLWVQLNPTQALSSTVKLARITLKSRSFPHVMMGADAMTPPADPDRELIVMVVGETARADHFSLNGYARETNPKLRKEKAYSFTDFWSCGTSTSDSLPCMFSHMTRADYDKPLAKATDNALDILKRAGVAVLWRDNNSSSKHVADRVTYEPYLDPDRNPVCDIECRDEGMLVGLQDYIDAHPAGDILIVVHQMGNHGPAYYKRYPASFEKFKPVCKTNDLGACSQQEIVNAYDNAILYTDYVLSRVIRLLKRNDDAFETAMFYVSDHGESLGESGIYLHGLPWLFAPDEQKHVAAVMWFGRNFDREPIAKMDQRRNERLSHDNIFHTLLGLFELRSETYDVKMDILDHSRPEHW